MGSLNPENSANQDLDDSGCVQDASVGENGYKWHPQLLDLSDDVLLYILQYLTPRDLKALGHTCPRLGTLICDRTLWTRVDARASPVGQQRLRWLLTHCLSPATTELKLAGYANKFSKCLGIQDLHWPADSDQEFVRGACIGAQDGVDVEHFLLRMWYPHLPRYAVSPRWPDKAEAESKIAKAEAEIHKAAEALAFKSREASSSSGSSAQSSDNSAPKAGSSAKSSSSSGYNSGISNQTPSSSGQNIPDLDKPDQNSSSSGQKPSSSAQNPWSLGQHSSTSAQNPCSSGQDPCYPENSEPNKENDEDPILFEDDVRDCKGPQFSLTKNLMKDLTRKCMHLTSLALEYCNLDYKTTNLRQFPLHLKKLSLRGSSCYNLPLNTSFLGKVQERLPELEYLDVSECDWFEPASLMPLSKLSHLTELYMRDCKRLTECVAYASLATRYGFRKLRVFDVRGSPLADSEVSALGWLPCLEELYVSPPEDFSTQSEHTHTWGDTRTVFNELDSWEIEEPEYYKVKSPEPEMEEDEKDEEVENERTGDVMVNNPLWSNERRIIVIQPNANRHHEEHMQRRPEDGEGAHDIPPRQGPRDPRPGEHPPGDPQPGPANHHLGSAYRLFAPRLCGLPGSIDIVPSHLNAVPIRCDQIPLELRAGPINPRPAPAERRLDPNPAPAERRLDPTDRPGPAYQRCGPMSPRPGPANPPPGPAYPPPGPANPQPGPANAGEGSSKRRFNLGHAIDLAKRRRVEDDEDQEMQVPLPDCPLIFPPYDPVCPRLRLEDAEDPELDPMPPRHPRFVRVRRREPRHIMQIDVDTHSPMHVGSHAGYHLVSDSALLRFGRAENENINYVHIGRNGIHHGSDSASRPDRSNLRILSVTGYRNITDRSLEHLVTAAPYLLHIDFSDTNVTLRGVEIFKAVRPDCDVIFSEFGRMA